MTWSTTLQIMLLMTWATACIGVTSRGRLRHDWDDGDDTNGGCCTSTTRHTCRTCGKVKERNNGMG